MSSKTFKFLFFGTLSLSLLLGNTAAFAQYNSTTTRTTTTTSDGVVVPTTSTGGSVPSGGSIPSNGTSRPINGTGIPTSPNVNEIARFSCQTYNGQYTVMYQPQSQPNQYFPWATPGKLGGGWNSQARCNAIANRLESYRQDGLVELQAAVENRENILCVTTETNQSCRIVLTVPAGKDVETVRNSVFQNLVSADNGQYTTAVNTYTSRGNGTNDLYNLGRTLLGNGNSRTNNLASSKGGINLKPFLDPKDGGTASGLRNGVARRQANPQKLNPNNFR
ncbi:MAG: COP23 domain-containing protein [Spirirestis rafaelensis WJT71-NPBG6]|jgi:hypothetical protein|nr:COP23 domain-containing protein [Spirirestis rafaelensis WJT71-NPBG6]